MKRSLLSLAMATLLAVPALADPVALKIKGMLFRGYSLSEFISAVHQESAAVKGKKLALDSAIALVDVMGFPSINPSLTYSRGAYYGSTPYPTFTSQLSDTVNLAFTIEGFGKREARQNFANAEVLRNGVELDWYRHSIEGDAVMYFIDALRLKEIWLALQKEKDQLGQLTGNGALDAVAESQRLQDILGKDIRYLSHGMQVYVQEGGREVPEPLGRLAIPARDLDAETLIQNAYAQRADLMASDAALKSAEAHLQMLDKGHNIDITPSLWYSRTPAYQTYSTTTTYGFSVTVPLPTSALYRADVRIAANYKAQLEHNIQEAKKRVRMEIQQALTQYGNAKEQLSSATDSLREASLASKNDVASIVTERQKTVDLIDAQTNHLKALVHVLRLSGEYTLPQL